MREYIRIISREHRAPHFYGVNEGQKVCDFAKRTAYKLKVKPRARKPRGEVCKERTAYAADLLIRENASAEKSERDEKYGCRDVKKHSQKYVYRRLKPKQNGYDVAYCSLRYGNGEDG